MSELKMTLYHLSKLLKDKRVEENDVKYLKEILVLLEESNAKPNRLTCVKLQILNLFLAKMVKFQAEAKELFHSYQSLTIILQFPESYLRKMPLIINQFIITIQNEENKNISDEEKIAILIDQFFLKQSLKSKGLKQVKKPTFCQIGKNKI